MNTLRTSLVPICIMILMSNATSLAVFESVTQYLPFMAKKEVQAVVSREYPVKPDVIVTIKNRTGNVHISTWNQDKIAVHAIKKAPTEDMLEEVALKDVITSQSVSLTGCQPAEGKTSIDYTLSVPAYACLHLTLEQGSAIITGPCKGKITALTGKGDIEIEQAHNVMDLSNTSSGAIKVKHAKANIKAHATKGTISIMGSHRSVIADSDYGNIEVHATEVPPTCKLKLATNHGLINLQLPRDVNADLQACTKRGTISSQHAITLKPRTTTLDQKAWKQFKEQVDGIIGSGEAIITLSTNKGNIKIMSNKTA